jgi:two-component system sensor histidine kinase YesM
MSQEEIMQYVPNYSPNFYKIVNLNGRHVNLNVMKISELNAYLVIIEDTAIVFKGEYKKITMLVTILIVLLFVLTAIYYVFSLNITTRVSKLAHHMKNVGEDNLTEFCSNTYKDEIGYLISSYNSMIRRIKDLIVKVQQEEIMRREAAYRALQAQIKPHFLYGTLETIRMLAKTNNDNEVEEIAFSLGKVMRYALATSDHVFLKNEIENVRAFLQIYKARLEENLQFTIENDDPSVINDFPCPQFILQPIVENSIKHGIRKISGIGIIRLKITDEGKYILITVEDNGVGITDERLQYINRMLEGDLDINEFKMDSGGFALYNIKERIKSFYGNESCIKLQSRQGRGTICTLKLMKK